MVDKGFIIRHTDPEKQVFEVLERLDLWASIRPFICCTECNGMIRTLSVTGEHRIPQDVFSHGAASFTSAIHVEGYTGKAATMTDFSI
jgi:uncharacterized protein with PIN domain